MIRYDIFDQELRPGDSITFMYHGELKTGDIRSITEKGTLQVAFFNPQNWMYDVIPRPVRTWRVIRIAGMPKKRL